MSSGPGLDLFLTELDLRRQRLLHLVGSSDQHARLLADVRELSEQLIAAEEELRVQQEELEATRQALHELRSERDHLVRTSGRAFVTTDDLGVVLEVTDAVERLIEPSPAVRLSRRPIATWFDLPDRREVRALISRAAVTPEPAQASGIAVSVGAQRQLVDLIVQRMRAPAGGQAVLRWEFMPVSGRSPSQPPVDFGDLSLALARCRSADEVYPILVGAALGLMPDGGQVGLTVMGPRGVPRLAAWSSETARRVDAAQLAARSGPLAEALATLTPVQARDLAPGEVVCGPALAVPLTNGDHRLGVLTLYPDDGTTIDDHLVGAAEVLARHASAALNRVEEVGNLRAAIVNRQLIGEAVGVLMERHRFTPEAAFAQLRQCSQDTNRKLRDIAQKVVETGLSPWELRAL